MTDEANAEGEGNGETASRERRLKRVADERNLDVRALESAQADARFTLEQTLELFGDLSEKSFRLIRLNALVLTLLVAIASQVTVMRYINVSSVAAVLLFVGSALFALVGYMITAVNRGFGAMTFEKLTRYRLRKKEYLTWILTLGYPEWITDGIEKADRKERWVRRSLIAFFAGIVTLLGGILMTIY